MKYYNQLPKKVKQKVKDIVECIGYDRKGYWKINNR